MGTRDVELAGFPGSGPFVTRRFRHQSPSIGTKRSILSVGVTVNPPSALENFSSCTGLRCCETIEWE